MEGHMSFGNEFRVHGTLAGDVRRGHTTNNVTTAFYVVIAKSQFSTADGIQSTTDFIPITTYGKQAENDLKYLAKGKEVSIKGRIRSWFNKTENRGGFCFEPVPGGVRYLGAPVTRPAEMPVSDELDSWLHDYDAAAHQFDAVPLMTRPARVTAHA
jgi:single-strand DNA-binding protein